ncbi:MAG TPA: DUF6614 family protein [Acetobacteraceae bacterium]|jgi:hypothetical protein|nr:DUF6614 family protein [Acetobacteraceae bacterium]
MDIYHAWCDLKPGVGDTQFADNVARYMGHLQEQGLIENWRLTRRKLGFGAPGLGEFHIMIEVKDLAQLEQAFERVAGRRDPVEEFHFGVNSLARNAVFALYRDFPDMFRHRGEERF